MSGNINKQKVTPKSGTGPKSVPGNINKQNVMGNNAGTGSGPKFSSGGSGPTHHGLSLRDGPAQNEALKSTAHNTRDSKSHAADGKASHTNHSRK